MSFEPVCTLADLDSLDSPEIQEGYFSAERGDPEPGPNRGRAFWHGWRCRMMDLHEIPIDADHRKLVKEYVQRLRTEKPDVFARQTRLIRPPDD
jgi:hypothetical protein